MLSAVIIGATAKELKELQSKPTHKMSGKEDFTYPYLFSLWCRKNTTLHFKRPTTSLFASLHNTLHLNLKSHEMKFTQTGLVCLSISTLVWSKTFILWSPIGWWLSGLRCHPIQNQIFNWYIFSFTSWNEHLHLNLCSFYVISGLGNSDQLHEHLDSSQTDESRDRRRRKQKVKPELLPMNRLLYSFPGQLKNQYVSYLRQWRSLKANVKLFVVFSNSNNFRFGFAWGVV